MPLSVTVLLYDERWKKLLRPYIKTVETACRTAFGKKKSRYEMTVVLANDAFVRDLNKTYRGKDKATNVLSFEGEGAYIGDVILAYETLMSEAKGQKKPPRHHALHLLIHGTLHLLGYDHEQDKQAKRMEALESKILQRFGVANPYLSDEEDVL